MKIRRVCDIAPESGCPDSRIIFVDELLEWLKNNKASELFDKLREE